MKSSGLIPLLFAALGLGAVIETDAKSLKPHLDSGVPMILDIYASWCGHCKSFSPVFDDLAKLYEHVDDKIKFVKIDGDKHRKVVDQFNVEYFPTIKWVKGELVEDVNGRSLEELQKLILDKTGLKPKSDSVKKSVPKFLQQHDAERNYVVQLDDSTFENGVDDKAALVAFTTTWCGHCKRLKPQWAELSQLYARDDDVVIAEVDCTENDAAALMETFKVKGFPTIIYFPKDGSTPKPYDFERSLDGFTKFLRKEGAAFRLPDGSLSVEAGLIPEITREVVSILADSAKDFSSVHKKLDESTAPHADKYKRIITKIEEKGPEYVRDEVARLDKLLQGQVSPEKLDNIVIRRNILVSLLEPPVTDSGDGDDDDKAKEEL